METHLLAAGSAPELPTGQPLQKLQGSTEGPALPLSPPLSLLWGEASGTEDMVVLTQARSIQLKRLTDY